jgi:nucleotide-binding universal stress UspA family protein
MGAEAATTRGAFVLAPRRPVVLAALGAASDHASSLAWALEEAAAWDAALRIVTLSPGPADSSTLRGQVAGHGLADSSTADLLIVGTGEAVSAPSVLASLPRSGRRRLAMPVIVLRGRLLQPIRRIVVGVISAAFAGAVLRWAVDEAAVHRADLIVVHAWQRHTGVGRSTWRDSLDRADAQRVVDEAVRDCVALTAGVVRGVVDEGDAGPVLVRASEDADLLVVGSRGQSGFTAMLFGSVTRFVVAGAGCPVALVAPQQMGPA